ncbi:MAG: hypothetical protein JWN40_3294 [Phycisphaerales bacterium]|nr:hypothetical protein [Phycisphaerales bacterium]
MRHRIATLNFPDADALKTATIHAYNAIEQLHSVAAELDRIATLQTWAGGQKQPETKPRDRRGR